MPSTRYTPDRDAYWRWDGSYNRWTGSSSYLQAGGGGASRNDPGAGDTVISFGSVPEVPAGHVLTRVVVNVYMTGWYSGGLADLTISRITSPQNWIENDGTSNMRNMISSGEIGPRVNLSGGAGWKTLDITDYCKGNGLGWLGSYGVQIGHSGQGEIQMFARENGNYIPELYIDTIPNDTSPPSLTLPSNGSISNNKRPRFLWTFQDPNGGSQSAYQIQCSTDSSFGTVNGFDTGKVGGGTQDWTLGWDLGDNQWYYRIRTWDQYDWASGWSWVPWFGIENVAPTASGGVQGTTYQSIQPNGTFRVWAYNVTDNWSGVTSVKFPTAGPGYDFQWRDGIKDGGTSNWYCDIPINAYNNNEGGYTTHVYGYDAAGNSQFMGQTATYVDRTGPTIASVSGQQYTKGDSRRIWAYGLSDGIAGVDHVTAFLVRPDGSYYPIQNASDGGGGNWYVDVSWGTSEQQGNWGVDFRGVDKANNTGAMTRAYVWVDRVNPTISSASPVQYVSGNGTSVRVTGFNAQDPSGSGIGSVKFYYRKSTDNGATWGGYVGPVTGTKSGSDWYYDVPRSGDGYYQVDIHVYDNAGNAYNNEAPPLITYFYVDTVKPADPNPVITSYDQTSVIITWNAFNDAGPSCGFQRSHMPFYVWDTAQAKFVPATIGQFRDNMDISTDPNVKSFTITGLTPGQKYSVGMIHTDKAGNDSLWHTIEFTTKKQFGMYKLTRKDGVIVSLPVYDPTSGVLGNKSLRAWTPFGVGCFELIPVTDPKASKLLLNTSQGIKSIAQL